MANPNLGLLIAMAQAMGTLREHVVFVGGCATGLLVDNVDLMDVRPTEDVDAIVEVASLTVMEGRSTVAQELVAADEAVRKHVGQSVAALLDMPTFHNALPGLLSDPEREQTIKTRLMQIAQLKEL